MIKVIHVSDFHLENVTLSTSKKAIVDAFCEDIKKYVDDSTILFFTGDLIDKGGIGFADKKNEAFKYFEQFFIEPVIKTAPILKNRIFIVPGNHDVFRSKIDPITEDGLRSHLNSVEAVNDFIINNRKTSRHLDRIADYKLWETKFYSTYPNAVLSNFENSFIVNLKGLNVGITCLNSSWLCKDDFDREHLLIGKNQLENSLDYIKECPLKLVLGHHPVEFLKDFDKEAVKIELFKKYEAFFTGHVHELGSSYIQDLYGNIFISIANSTIADNPKERKFVNGYSVFELYPNEKIKGLYRRYVETHTKFVPNTEIGTDDGTKEFPLLKDGPLAKFEHVLSVVDLIENQHCEKLNDDLITSNSALNTIDSIFVEPTILNCPQRSFKEEDTIRYSLETILNRGTNFLIYGLNESGKTILLDKMFLDTVKKFNILHKIPIYLKFSKFKAGKIDKVIQEFLGQSKEQTQDLLTNNDSILFIDDLCFLEKNLEQIGDLKTLITKYPRMQIIATSDQILENIIPTDYLDHNDVFQFEIGFIQNLSSTEIKHLIAKWFVGKEIDFKDSMQKLIKSFVDFGLPKTPLSVTLFLWIFEKQEKRPLNNSVLVEMFIENLLEKTNIENIYSETFDFKNKQRLLSFTAKYMREKGDGDLSYSVDYVKLLTFMQDYLKTRFPGKPQKVLDDFIKRGILCYEEDNLIRFKSNFFFHYFLALHFDYNPSFKKEVFTGENYLDYIEEIIYYTGLKRDDFEVLKFTQDRLDEAFNAFNQDVSENFKKIDSILEAKNKSETLSIQIDDEWAEKKATDAQLDKLYDNQLSAIPVQKNIPKKGTGEHSTKKNIDIVLKLAANVLKNSEDVDDFNLKIVGYKKVLLSSISFLMQYRDALIVYYKRHQKGPDNFPKNIDFPLLIRVLPLIHQVIIYDWLGSQKLRPVIIDKIEKDKSAVDISEFERFLSIFIYADIRGENYPRKIQDFLKTVNKNYIKDLSFLKIFSYYHLRTNSEELDDLYLKLLAEIKADLGYVSKNKKSQFMKETEENKMLGKY